VSAVVSKVTEIGALVLFRREEARTRILDAVTRCDGNITRASEELGVVRRVLLRYVADLALSPDIDLIRARLAAQGVKNRAISATAPRRRKSAKKPGKAAKGRK